MTVGATRKGCISVLVERSLYSHSLTHLTPEAGPSQGQAKGSHTNWLTHPIPDAAVAFVLGMNWDFSLAYSKFF